MSKDEAHAAFPFHKAVEGFKRFLYTLGLNARDYRADIENMRQYYLIQGLPVDMPAPVAEQDSPSNVLPFKCETITLPRSIQTRKHPLNVNPYMTPRVRPSRNERRKAAKAVRVVKLGAALWDWAKSVAGDAARAYEARVLAERIARGEFPIRGQLNLKAGDVIRYEYHRSGDTWGEPVRSDKVMADSNDPDYVAFEECNSRVFHRMTGDYYQRNTARVCMVNGLQVMDALGA